MQISLVSPEEAGYLSKGCVEFGTCSKLLGTKQQAKKFRGMQNYGCRHCVYAGAVGKFDAIADTEAQNARRLFNFNGLRSHVKAK
jgi:hypothetical protein